MNRARCKQSLIFILLAAFLSLQWSSAHIHLASQHEHDGDQHQHAATAHNHQLATHHQDIIDFTDVEHESSSVVELDKLCTIFKAKQVEPEPVPVVLAQAEILLSPADSIEVTFYPFKQLSFNHYLENTSVRLRAPPSFS